MLQSSTRKIHSLLASLTYQASRLVVFLKHYEEKPKWSKHFKHDILLISNAIS